MSHYLERIIVERIDDGVRAKLVCLDCRTETYVRLLFDHTQVSVHGVVTTLAEVANNHMEECRG